MKALEKAQAIYDLTMNERCEEKVEVLFSKGLYRLMIDLFEELEELKSRCCDNCKNKAKFCNIYNIAEQFGAIKDVTKTFSCSEWESK